MAQLKMYWLPGSPVKEEPLPEGYSISNYRCEEDRIAWHHICLNGLTSEGDEKGAWEREIATWPDIDPYKDMFFLDYKGEHIGTITAFVWKEKRVGDVHMVSIRTDFRGKGLAKYLTQVALLKHSKEKDLRWVELTTSESRIPAVKGYLSAGFLPVEYDYGMEERWESVLETFQMDHIQMLYEDATPYKIIYRKSKANHPVMGIGVVGAKRGRVFMEYCKKAPEAALAAVCDKDEDVLDAVRGEYGNDVSYYTDFDKMLQDPAVGCVVLANYANEHAPLAIKAMRAGKHVISEVLPVQNMKEAVELVETVEQTGKVYAYAENCCFMPALRKMKWIYKMGWVGEFEYGEGEYVHNCEPDWYRLVEGREDHWRNRMDAFYYCTHATGPIVHVTGLRPVSVIGVEGPGNARMSRMGAQGAPFGVEMITLENGAVIKCLQGLGLARNSLWYSAYFTRGRMETARNDSGAGETGKLYMTNDKTEAENDFWVQTPETEDGLSKLADGFGHGGSEYYIMHNAISAMFGNEKTDYINVYEAMDMFLPGLFAYRSALVGSRPCRIPDLRDKDERDRWRNDTSCPFPEAAGDMLIAGSKEGHREIPKDTFEKLKEKQAWARELVEERNNRRKSKE